MRAQPDLVSRTGTTRKLALALAIALSLAACGGSDDGDSAAGGTTVETAAPVEDTTDAGGGTAVEIAGSGDYDAGDITYRVVNLLDEPVDLYVRTDGFVEAFFVEAAVAPGAVTDFYAPPVDGRFVVTEAGAGDATCVIDCPHFIAELSSFADSGPVHTVVLYQEDGQRSAFDLWELPTPAAAGNANAMIASDATTALVVVTAIAVTGADFGLRLGIEGTTGCIENTNLANVLIGGNQTPAFAYSGVADLLLFDNQDRECSGEPVGGPFTVSGDVGSRTHVILTGSPGAMDAVIVAMQS